MSIRTLMKLTLVAVAAAVIPACGASDKTMPPLVIDWTPIAPGNTTVARMPNIIVKFDRDMTASTVTNTANWAVVKSGGGAIVLSQVEYLPQLREARLFPNILLEGDKDYGIFVGGAITSSTGVPVGGTFLLDVFHTNNVAGNTIAFGGATAAGGAAAGTIDVAWANPAQEGGVDLTEYDVFVSTVSGGEDLLVRAAPGFQSISSLTGGTLTGLTAGTQYFIKVQPRSGTSGNVLLSLVEITATATP
jgi:hypothetical protein